MALISDKAIPVEWANTTGWTRSFSGSPILTDKGTKRPLIPANEADSAPTLVELLAGENPVNPIGYCGFLSSMSTPYAIIDIDAPKGIKEMLKAKRAELGESAEFYQMVDEQIIQPLPQPIKTLIQESYAEYSASGTGVHVVIRVDKSQFPQHGAKGGRSKAYWKARDFDGQLSVSNNYMVTTGRVHASSSGQIKEVPFSLLDLVFGITRDNADTTEYTHDNETIISSESLPSLTEVENALMIIPLDQGPRIKEVYKQVTGTQYEHYDFWLHVGMALHDYATRAKQLTNGLAMFIKWSVLDKEGFVSDDDVAAKWNSFRSDERPDGITYKTLFKLSLAFQFNYPRRIRAKDGALLLNPEKTEYVNFRYLMDKYHIELYQANGIEIYITGDEDIIQKYFMLQGVNSMFGYYGPYDTTMLQAATWRLCQDSMWKGLTSTQNFVQTWLTERKPEVDMFSKWLDEDDDKLPMEYKYPRYFPQAPRVIINKPEMNTLDFVINCIDFEENQDVELCKQMLYRTFMQLIKLHEPGAMAFEDNGGMFALIGPENTYKTTFFKLLLPVPLEFLRKDVNQEISSEKNKRDFIRDISTRAIVLVDEFEGFMDQKKSGSFFKSVISGNVTSFTDIYQTREQTLKRKAIIVGTSNDARQIISDNGSRRLWFARIKSIDTMALMNVNFHKLYQNVRNEFRDLLSKGKLPWLMSFNDTKRVTRQNKGIKAMSSTDLNLRELFPYTTEYNVESSNMDLMTLVPNATISAVIPVDSDKPSRFMKTQHVVKLLKFNGFDVPTTAELERSLERFCMAFIGQERPVIALPRGAKEAAIERGRLCLNKRKDGNWNHKFWILPIEEDFDVSN